MKSKILIIGIFLLFLKLEFNIWNLWTADTMYANAQSLQRENKYFDAYQNLKQAIDQLPDEPVYLDEMAQLTAGLALAANEKDSTLSAQLAEAAITYSNLAIASSPENIVFYKSRSRILYSLSLLNKQYLFPALEAITKAVYLAPTDAKVNYFYGLLLSLNGDNQKAIAVLEKTVAMKIDYRDAHFELAKIYLLEKQNAKAKEQAEFIINKIGDDKEVKKWMEEKEL